MMEAIRSKGGDEKAKKEEQRCCSGGRSEIDDVAVEVAAVIGKKEVKKAEAMMIMFLDPYLGWAVFICSHGSVRFLVAYS
ncbi:hypothetical protein LIER_13744 [Lithospermum erythrorhizon]|uniref:Uncharacterized protein n=1 Tax=Lithospermum erythrorhizon TaxID=34254 RepID=A0AAV3PWI0_LITER